MPKEIAKEVEPVLTRPVDQDPDVAEATNAYQVACREYAPVHREYRRMLRIASPAQDEASNETHEQPSRLERLEAEAKVSEIKKQVLLLQAKMETAEHRRTQVRMETVERFSTARRQSPERRDLMRRLFQEIDETILPLLKAIGDYDTETQMLGGRSGERVYAELDPGNSNSRHEFLRARFQDTGEL
jgi:hypothetical protein